MKKLGICLLAVMSVQLTNAAKIISAPESPTNGWECPKNGHTGVLYPVTKDKTVMFYAPKWKGGAFDWPAYENRSLPRDWSQFDRLAIPVYFDSKSVLKHTLAVYLSDSKRPLRKGAYFQTKLLPLQSKMIVLPIRKKFQDKKIDAKDIVVAHFYTQNPPSEFRLYVGKMILLKPGEAVPKLPQELVERANKKRKLVRGNICKQMEDIFAKQNLEKLSPDYRLFWNSMKQNFLNQLQSGEIDDVLLMNGKNIIAFQAILKLLPILQNQPWNDKNTSDNLLIGYAPSTTKVLPQAPIFKPLPKNLRIEVARNENESVQLVVMPMKEDCRDVEIRFSEFAGSSGQLSKTTIQAIPVGFVETRFIPASGSRYVGFWPDPLLSFLPKVTVKAGEAQPFWVKTMISQDQPAGKYHGNAEIYVAGKIVCKIPMTIKVHDFILPNHSLLPLAVTFGPTLLDENKKHTTLTRWRKHRRSWHEMLDQYYLHFDSLYHGGPNLTTLKFLKELKDQGKLGVFNLGNFNLRNPNFAGSNPKGNYGMQRTIDRIRRAYKNAKKLGLLDHAYIYGADEAKKEDFYRVKRAASILKKEFPGVPVLTTAGDTSYSISSVDAFCPLTSHYNPQRADKARKAGKQVWWYISLDPHSPFPNNFIESRGIEIRLLMGAMTVKYRPDGFLYYQISLWNTETPMTHGPYTGWDARSYIGYNGDGNWCYPGPDYTPLGTIRLENFRDGLEDYAYVKILEQRLAAAQKAKKNNAWQQKAQKALAVPVGLVKSMEKYSVDDAKLQKWRNYLAKLIESAPCK